MTRARERALDLGLAALLAAQLGASAWLLPSGDQVALPGGGALGPACWFRAATGIACPFCGMTRSFVAFAHGELSQALQWHPVGPALWVAMFLAVVACVAAAATGRPPIFARHGAVRVAQAVAVVCVGAGVFQMVRS